MHEQTCQSLMERVGYHPALLVIFHTGSCDRKHVQVGGRCSPNPAGPSTGANAGDSGLDWMDSPEDTVRRLAALTAHINRDALLMNLGHLLCSRDGTTGQAGRERRVSYCCTHTLTDTHTHAHIRTHAYTLTRTHTHSHTQCT